MAAPSERELEILKVLWEIGPATVREVQTAILRDAASRPTLRLRVLEDLSGWEDGHETEVEQQEIREQRRGRRIGIPDPGRRPVGWQQ